MELATVIGAALVGLATCYLLIRALLRFLPGASGAGGTREFHHTHTQPVSRLGGLAIFGAFLAGCAAAAAGVFGARPWNRDLSIVLLGSGCMFLLGLADDLRPLGARRKLLGQVLVAIGVYALGLQIQAFKVPFTNHIADLNGWGLLVTVLWLVAITNLVNLIDGADGLAGGICLMLLILLAYVCRGYGPLLWVVAGLAGALLGFLRFNFPPARIYMGDGGAYFLGFFIAAATITSSQKGTILAALAAPLFVLALPILDTMLAILRRGLRGLPLFRADRRHIHHHLAELGLSRRKVVLWLYAFTLVFLALGLAAFSLRGLWVAALVGVGGLVVLVTAGNLSFSREWFAVGRVVGGSLAMRQEVRYALTQTEWLKMEAKRAPSLASLWEDLVFIAAKLGFSGVRLNLPEGERVWHRAGACKDFFNVTYPLNGGCHGSIELTACPCSSLPRFDCARCAGPQNLATETSYAEQKTMAVLSELLAEAWDVTLKNWTKLRGQPICFDAESVAAPSPPNGTTGEAAVPTQGRLPLGANVGA